MNKNSILAPVKVKKTTGLALSLGKRGKGIGEFFKEDFKTVFEDIKITLASISNCIWIENGEWMKLKGECGESAKGSTLTIETLLVEESVEEEPILEETILEGN